MKKLPLLLVAAFALFFFSSCTKDATTVAPVSKHRASIMFVNGCSGAATVNPYFSGKAVTGVSSVNLFSNSGYVYVDLDTLYPATPIAFNRSGGTLASTSYVCHDDVHYSAFAGGTTTAPTISFVEDIFSGGSGSNAHLRFVNLTGDVNNVTFKVENDIIFSAIDPAQVTAFTEVSAGEKTFTVYDPDHFDASQRIYALRKLEAGKFYTVIYTGLLDGAGSNYLQLTQITNL